MKTALVLGIVPIALSCLLQGQVHVAGKSETSYVADRSVWKSDSRKQPAVNNEYNKPAALFFGNEPDTSLTAAAKSDDGVVAAQQAIAAARERIRSNPTCQKFFHDQGEQVLEQTRFTMQYLTIPNIAAQVEGNVVLLNRNPNGAFMKPKQHIMGLTDPTEIRGFYVLHELAHELCRYTRYISDHQASAHENEFRTRLNNELLFLNCYNAKRSVAGAR
jgi:hypothetical protein